MTPIKQIIQLLNSSTTFHAKLKNRVRLLLFWVFSVRRGKIFILQIHLFLMATYLDHQRYLGRHHSFLESLCRTCEY